MKKKISSLITAMFILLVCVFASACGDRYKNMEFKVYYAFTANATDSEWQDGTNGISLNYDANGGDDSSLVFGEDGLAHLFLKVEIKNVKSKHLDKIVISVSNQSGLDFVSGQINNKGVIDIPIINNSNVNTTLKFYENNSGKRYETSFVVSKTLTGITANHEIAPTLIAGGELNLIALDNLRYEPYQQTNQIGVTYSVESMGKFDSSGVYDDMVLKDRANEYLGIVDGKLSIVDPAFKIDANSYAVKIKATSIFHDGKDDPDDEISTTFYVYLVESGIGTPVLKYVKSPLKEVKDNEVVKIYENGGDYSKSTISVSLSGTATDSIYLNEIYLENGKSVKLNPIIEIKNSQGEYKKYDFLSSSHQAGINGLIVKDTSDLNGWKYEFSIANRDVYQNDVRVSFDIDGLDFSASSKKFENNNFVVEKHVLPTFITINDVQDVAGGKAVSGQVYGTTNEKYLGVQLKLSATPNEDSNREIILSYPAETIKISRYLNGKWTTINDVDDTQTKIISGQTIAIRYTTSSIAVATDETDITIKTINTPDSHDGQSVATEYLSITYSLEKLVTANAFEFVDKNDQLIDDKCVIDAEVDGNIYVRVYHTGELDKETVNVKSNNSKILFTNNSTEISLSDCSVRGTGIVSGANYTIYQIPVKATNSKLSADITIKAGDGTINDVQLTCKVESVYTATEEQMAGVGVVADSNEITSFNDDTYYNAKADNGAYNFAIPFSTSVEFAVADSDNGTNIEKAIYGLTKDTNLDFTSDVSTFKNTQVDLMVHSNYQGFSVVGTRANKTQIAKLTISYYDKNLKLKACDIFVQIAVYDKINEIHTSFANGKDTIGYVNAYYDEISSTEFSFTGYSTTGVPQSSIFFAPTYEDGIIINSKDVKKVNNLISYELEDNIPTTLDDKFEKIEIKDGNKVKVALTGSVEGQNFNTLEVKVVAKRFGNVEQEEMVEIKIATVQKANRIVYSSAQFDEQNELSFSFMDVADGGYDEKSLNVELEFGSSSNQNSIKFDEIAQALTHMIYTVDIDEDGDKHYTKVSDNYFQVTYNDGSINIKAFKGREGGKFVLVLATKDSYCGIDADLTTIEANKEKEDFKKYVEIAISVSDGTANAAYKIYNADDLKKINNNLSAHYVLASNIDISTIEFTPIGLVGSTLYAFEGNLNGEYISINDGKSHTYTITMKVEKSVESTENGTLTGLFGVVGTNAKIQNLNLVVEFVNSFNSTSSKGLKVASLAGVNKGTIENVVINLNAKQEIAFGATAQIDFGGIVAVNNGQIISSQAKANQTINVKSASNVTHNFGFVAGVNAGTIKGDYLGKDSLKNFIFDVVTDLCVSNSSTQTNTTYYIGSVAGTNSGTIENMLVGGNAVITEALSSDAQQVGAIGGLVGNHTSGKIDTSVALSLDIQSTADNIDVAGIAGHSSAEINYVKFVSAKTDFGSFTGFGQVEGLNLVAGVVAKATGGTIIYSSVESFIQTLNSLDFPTVTGGTTTAGLVAENAATIEKSFVHANIDGANSIILVSTSGTDTYFIGKVLGTGSVTNSSTFSVVNGTAEGTWDNNDGVIWSNDENYNGVINNGVEDKNIPYLLYSDAKPLMIIAPKSISANVDQDYVTKIDSVYVDDFDLDTITVKETVLVNYFAGAGDEANTHNIYSECKDGLLNVALIPNEAQGGLRYQIIGDGYRYAYINDSNQIVFTGVSGKTAILVRIYSVFNPDIQVFVVFYTHNLFTDLEISSSSVYENELNIYTGEGNKVVALTTKNVFEDKEYTSLFNVYGMSSFLTVEVKSNESNSQLSIAGQVYSGTALTGLDYNGIAIRIKDNSDFGADYEETITFDLYLINYYTENIKIKLGSVNLKVRLYNIATGVDINGDDVEISTLDDITFEAVLTTNFVNKDNSNLNILASVNSHGKVELNYGTEESDYAIIRFDILSGDEELTNLLTRSGKTHFADLFNYNVARTHYIAQDKSILGYRYQISLELIDEHYYRYIENNIKFNVVVYAKSGEDNGEDISDSIEVLMKPTTLSTARIENYAVSKLNVATDYSSIVANDNAETSIVTPGSLGNIMMIYLEPTYSNVEKAFIKTSSVFVPSLNKDVQMKFTQLVWDARVDGGSFVTLYAGKGYTQQDDSLQLELLSEIDISGNRHYTGVICVYIQLEKFGGLETTLTATLEVETNDGKQVTRKRNLLTTYLPQTSISFEEEQKIEDNGYLIQQGTNGNEIDIEIYGYQFNSNPVISFKWKTAGVSENVKSYISYYLERDFSKVQANANGAYIIPLILNVGDNIPAPIVVSAELSLTTKEGQLETATSSITLYPVDFLLTSVEVADVYVPVNQSTLMSVTFNTKNTVKDSTDDILNKLETAIGADKIGKLFTYYKGENLTFAENDKHTEFTFEYDEATNSFVIVGKETFETSFDFSIDYAYVDDNSDGVYELTFATAKKNIRAENIKLSVSVDDSEEEILVYSAEDIFDSTTGQWKLKEGGYYVLMQDIYLENVVPIETNISQFDGNNRRIYIKSFKVDYEKSNYGLFAKIGTFSVTNTATNETKTKQTILKNMIVDYGMFDSTQGIALNNNSTNSIVFGGLVAENDGGLIYNCDVMNTGSSQITISLLVPTDSSVVFGGLVGNNKGIITNSRVGRDGYTHIESTGSTRQINAKGINFEIYYQKAELSNNNRFESLIGGFVGTNSGTISTSYVANTGIDNYSTCEQQNGDNKTAGFVARNSGTISYSYVEADDRNVTTSNPYTDGFVIKNSGNGVVAGFVHENSGNVNNSYANTMLETKSAFISGFVYNNTGTISESYAACTMNANTTGLSESVASYAEQPFVGVDESTTLLSNGTLENTYYLMRSSSDNPYQQGDKDIAYALNENNFQNSEYLVGFSFVLTNSQAERQQGIWSYYSIDNIKRVLPELINADLVAHSYRYVIDETADVKVLTSVTKYAEGTANNPHIIASAEDFNKVFTSQQDGKFKGYVRLINNINFKDNQISIKTITDFTLGVDTAEKTSFDGNGLSIDGIYLEVQHIASKVGLFAEIKNAYVKNLNLSFENPQTDGEYSTKTAQYLGGLAGKIEDSVILNISLEGSSTTLSGKNFVGGLAGHISGQSLIYGITTNISVQSSWNEDNLYYSSEDYTALNLQISKGCDYETYLTKLSYAGGVAGVIDLDSKYGINYNLQFIDVMGDEMANKLSENTANISAKYAGGVAGFASSNTSAYKLRYFTGDTDRIFGDIASGGLYGISMGSILASQVTAEEDTQYIYDTNIGDYIKKLQANELDSALEVANVEKYGNLDLVGSYKYAGGLVGVALNSTIRASYAKVGIQSGTDVGGLAGVSVASVMNYSYAIPFVHLNENLENVGGLIGSSYGVSVDTIDRNNEIKDFEAIVKQRVSRKSTDIQFTFSTLILQNNELMSVDKSKTTLDYICANYREDGGTTTYLQSNATDNFVYVYAGTVKYNQIIQEGEDPEDIVKNQTKSTNKSAVMQLFKLYSVGDAAQELAFREVFGAWDVMKYWSLKEEKYFPLLKNERIRNVIEIDSKEDFDLIRSNPEADFVIIKDIDLGDLDTNWVIPGTFKGTITGLIDGDSRRPVISINSITPNQGGTTGFFERTLDAQISNIEIEWGVNQGALGAFKITNNSISMVSGLICDAENTLIQNVHITGSLTGSAEGYVINNTDKTIGGFAGIVGNSVNTRVLASFFSGKVEAKIGGSLGEDVYVAGIMGQGETIEGDSEEDSDEDEITHSSYISGSSTGVGKERANEFSTTRKYPVTSFNLTVDALNSATIYVGGVAGHTKGVGISSCNVGGVENETDYKEINFDLNLDGIQTYFYLGGISGYNSDGLLNNSDAVTNMSLAGSCKADDGADIRVGGLVGYYTMSAQDDLTGIYNCNTKNNIFDKDDKGLINKGPTILSNGIAQLTTNSVVQQCLFTGEICTNNFENSSLEILYSGGAVGLIAGSNGRAEIQEVSTNSILTVGTSGTNQLYAGGLIGQGNNLNLSYSNSWGRIIPITSSTATEIKVGGIIGEIIENASISNCYTTTSIVADSVAPKSIAKLTMGGLVGKIENNSKVEFNRVYYSSDYALFAEENEDKSGNPCGTNLNAQALIYSSVWHTGLQDGVTGIWKTYKIDGKNKMPYLASLESSLKTYGIFTKERESLNYDYVEGSPMRPKQIYANSEVVLDESTYKYYLLLTKAENERTTPEFTGSLNGILIGQELSNENPFVVGKLTEDSERESAGIVSDVLKHSAISNLHVKVTSKLIGGNMGVIAGTNNGVIFNCSVQGVNIDAGNGMLGLIAYHNNGMVSYCYSSAEVIKSTNVGGIVYQNDGKMLSNYFTGYIESSGKSAGMFVIGNDGNIYVYNNYMAGVINSQATRAGGDVYTISTNFAGITNTNLKEIALNNYIDNFSDCVFASFTTTITNDKGDNVLTPINTAALMGANQSKLDGEWYYTVDDGTSILNVASKTFGINYNYPIYKFNKIDDVANNLVDDLKHSLKTGKGEINETKLGDRYSALVDGKEDVGGNYVATKEYENAFKIPHLGVLSSINGLGDRNYVLIYDIDGKISESANVLWQSAVIETSESFNGFTLTAFNGVFVSNKYMSYNKATKDNNQTCVVKNINQHGLLGVVETAYIGDITLGNFKNLDNSGALAVAIKKSENAGAGAADELKTIINNIYFEEDTIISSGAPAGATLNYYGALFGEIRENATLKINNIYTDVNKNKNAVTLYSGNVSTTGLIAGINKGTIILMKTDDSTYYVGFEGNTYAGGLVGEMSNGTIDAGENEVHVFTASSLSNSTSVVGGLIAKTTGESNNNISNVTVVIHPSNENVCYNSFGGIVGIVQGVTTIESNVTLSVKDTALNDLNFYVRNEADGDSVMNAFGLIAGWVNADLTVSSFKFGDKIMENLSVSSDVGFGENSRKCGVGSLIGAATNGTLTILCDQDASKIKSINAEGMANVGMVVGYLSTATLNLGFSFEETNTIISGKCNVGGIIGWASSGIDNITFEVDKSLFESEKKFATVLAREGMNFGGLIGKWNGDNKNGDGEFVLMNNVNPIVIAGAQLSKDSVLKEENNGVLKAENIGGVVGKLDVAEDGSVVSKLQNNASITYSEDYMKNVFSEDDEIIATISARLDGDVKQTTNAVNVGGVIGYLTSKSSVEVNNLFNYADVYGYQNVGGLIGLIKDNTATLTNCGISTTDSEGNETDDINLSYSKDGGISVGSGTLEIRDGIQGGAEAKAAANASNIVGTINVGGAVGASDGATIKKVYVSKKVFGNSNVGGLIGYPYNTTLKNNIVQGVEKEKGVFEDSVVAIYYGFMTLKFEDKTYKPVYSGFIPTNVGGLAGKTNATKASYNVVKEVIISSAEEGKLIELLESGKSDDNSQVLSVISTISNNMYDCSTCDYEQLTQTNVINYDAIKSGYGSMYGCVDSDSINSVSTNYLVDPQITAQLGVNVGTYYGVYKATSAYFEAPEIYGDNISINGAYQVGGVVGSVDYSSGTNFPIVKVGGGEATITVQDKFSGMYIGGLIGKTVANEITGLSLSNDGDVSIKINAKDNYMIGGLIGLAQGTGTGGIEIANCNVGTWEKEKEETEEKMKKDSDDILITDDKNSSELGGLIGLLKVNQEAPSSGVQVTVSGNHKFPFTVNTIENINYTDEDAKFAVDDSTDISLMAEAGYSNLDTFNISGSKDKDLYDGDCDTNPIRPEAQGWSKEYTGFKRIQRCIPNGGATWDSIAIIYDAKNISHVATIKSLGLNASELAWPSFMCKDGKLDTDKIGEDYICFTIYDRGDDKPVLYSPMGIASPYYDPNSDELKFGTPKDMPSDLWKTVVYVVFTQSMPPEIYYLDMSKNDTTKGLTYFDMRTDKNYTTIGGYSRKYQNEKIKFDGSGNLEDGAQKYVTYGVDNYLGSSSLSYFVFDVIFNNASLTGQRYEGSSGQIYLGTYTDDYLPRSGSIFDVAGQWTSEGKAFQMNTKSGEKFTMILTLLSFAVDVVVTLGTAGAGGALAAGVKALIKGAGKAAAKQAVKHAFLKGLWRFTKGFFKHVGRKFKSMGLKGILKYGGFMMVSVGLKIAGANLQINHYIAEELSFGTFISASDSTYGYLGATYSRQLIYDRVNGTFKPTSDKTIEYPSGTGAYFTYYSATRPQDYFLNAYVGFKIAPTHGTYVEDKYDNTILTGVTTDDVLGIGLVEDTKYKDYSQKFFTKVYNKIEDESGNIDDSITIGMDKDGNYYVLQKKYIYVDSAYYICVEAGDVTYSKHTLTPESYSGEPQWLKNNNLVYTYGKYNNTNHSYDFDGHDDNNVAKSATGEYTINGVKIGEKDVVYTPSKSFNYGFDKADADYNPEGEEGYDWFGGAYYSPSGKSIPGAPERYAVLGAPTTTQPAGKSGVDYILVYSYETDGSITIGEDANGDKVVSGGYLGKYLIVDGEYVTATDAKVNSLALGTYTTYRKQTNFLSLVSIENGEPSGRTEISNRDEIKGSIGSKYYTKVYPYSTTENPYSTSVSDVWQNFDGSGYFVYSEDDTDDTISGEPTYYLYDGGYVVDEEYYKDGNMQAAYVLYAEIIEVTNGTENNTFDDTNKTITVKGLTFHLGDSDSYKNMFIKKGTESGKIIYCHQNGGGLIKPSEKIEVKYGEESAEINTSDLITNFDTYKNYYFVKDDCVVGNMYHVKNGKLYLINEEFVVKDGQLCTTNLIMPENEGLSMYGNMYLSNSTYELYTRYRYVSDGTILSLNSIASWKGYSAVPLSGSAELNNGYVTELIESVRVRLNGMATETPKIIIS